MGGGETAGPLGLAELGAGEPIIIYGSTGLALRRHRNVTKNRARGFGP
jgi:hypothetical protein